MNPTRKTLKKRADKLFRDYITKDGLCEWCGREAEGRNLQCAHIFSRRFLVTRWDPLNGLSLCGACHRKAHDRPIEFTEWLKDWLGEAAYNDLRRKAQTCVDKVDVEETIKKLTKLNKGESFPRPRCTKCGKEINYVIAFDNGGVCIDCKDN